MGKFNILTAPFASIYPLYLKKAEKKNRTKAEVDEIIRWLTGYQQTELEEQLAHNITCASFFQEAPAPNPERFRIKGTICGVNLEEITEPVMREIRCLDKLIDDLAKGKSMEKILRKG